MINGTSPPKLGVAQCAPDLSVGDCLKCLKQLKNTYIQCCGGKAAWYVLKRSCQIVFDDKSKIDTYIGISGVANGNASAPKRYGDRNGSSTSLDGSGADPHGGKVC